MTDKDKGQITVVGAGLMGTAIATLCAGYGYRVRVCDPAQAMLDSFAERAGPVAAYLSETVPGAGNAMDRIHLGPDLAPAVEGSFLVQEAIHEDMAAKQALFEELDRLCAPEVLLATNTSSLMLTEIGRGLVHKARFLGIHYVSPAHLVRAVEIIATADTAPATTEAGKSFLATIDRTGILCRDHPGFLINRIQYALKAELMRIVDEGTATVEDIDTAVRLSIGPRLALWGPMLQEDLSTSKATVGAVSAYLAEALDQPHYLAAPVLGRLVEAGETGAAAGAGWYAWTRDRAGIAAERDRQLDALLTWLRDNDRRSELGMTPRAF